MAERSPQEIAAAQLNIDVEEAKRHILEMLLDDSSETRTGFVESVENLIGKVVMRWWFARIVKNSVAQGRVNPHEIEERRRQRALHLISAAEVVNSKSFKGEPPDARSLQLSIFDLACAQNALWQALIDAAIIHPDTKQDYLDGGVREFTERVGAYASRLDLGSAAPGQGSKRAN